MPAHVEHVILYSLARPAALIHEQNARESVKHISEQGALRFPKAPICSSDCVGSPKKNADSSASIMGNSKATTGAKTFQPATSHYNVAKEFICTGKKLEEYLEPDKGAATRLA
jgi:hypothetical protein